MSDYRNASAIALYDAQVMIELTDYNHPFHEFRFGTIKIDGFDLNRLAQAFGYRLDRVGNKSGEDVDFDLLEPDIYNYGSDYPNCEIIRIEAKIDGPQMLSLKIHEQWSEDLVIREISYCGKYSIEWNTQENT